MIKDEFLFHINKCDALIAIISSGETFSGPVAALNISELSDLVNYWGAFRPEYEHLPPTPEEVVARQAGSCLRSRVQYGVRYYLVPRRVWGLLQSVKKVGRGLELREAGMHPSYVEKKNQEHISALLLKQ